MKRSRKNSRKHSGKRREEQSSGKKRYWIFFIFLSLAILVVVIFSPPWRKSRDTHPLRPSALAPDFKLRCLDNSTITLSDLSGKVVLLNFWASWCAPCRMEMPALARLYDRYKDEGFTVVGVTLDTPSRGNPERFVERMKINYPICFGNREIVKSYGWVSSIPTSFIIDRERKLRYKLVGYRSERYFEKLIRGLLEAELPLEAEPPLKE